MRDREIDEILSAAARVPGDTDPALLNRIVNTIGSSAKPVSPLPPRRLTGLGLLLICGVLAAAGAARRGIYGLPRLDAIQIAAIFTLLGVFTWVAALLSVDQMTPGSRRRVGPGWAVAGGSLALAALFAALFDDYRTHRFVHAGLSCLTAGLVQAVPSALAGWWVLRRGCFVTPVAAGTFVGILGGLAGITMLELHCPNFEALHVMVWHTAVLPASAALGAVVGKSSRPSTVSARPFDADRRGLPKAHR